MLCLSPFPTFTPSNFVRVIDSSVPCTLAFWLCFVTPHLYQLAWLQSGGLSFKTKQNKTASLGALWHSFPLWGPLSPGTHSGHGLVSPPFLLLLSAIWPQHPQGTVGGWSRTSIPRCKDGDRVRVSAPRSWCSGRASPALALVSGTSLAPLPLRQHQGSSTKCRVGGAAVYK